MKNAAMTRITHEQGIARAAHPNCTGWSEEDRTIKVRCGIITERSMTTPPPTAAPEFQGDDS